MHGECMDRWNTGDHGAGGAALHLQMTFEWPVGYYRLAPAAGHSGVYGAGLSSPECDACRATEHVAPCGWLRRSPVVESP